MDAFLAQCQSRRTQLKADPRWSFFTPREKACAVRLMAKRKFTAEAAITGLLAVR